MIDGLKWLKKKKNLSRLILFALLTLSATTAALVFSRVSNPQEPRLITKIGSSQVTPTPQPTVTPTAIPTAVPTAIPEPTVAPAEIPTPIPTAVPSFPATDYEAYFDQYSSQFNVDKNQLKKIANCESHIQPGSVNGDYGGMFQFASSTWVSTRTAMGLDTNTELRFNAEEAIRTAAFKIGSGGASAWANCL